MVSVYSYCKNRTPSHFCDGFCDHIRYNVMSCCSLVAITCWLRLLWLIWKPGFRSNNGFCEVGEVTIKNFSQNGHTSGYIRSIPCLHLTKMHASFHNTSRYILILRKYGRWIISWLNQYTFPTVYWWWWVEMATWELTIQGKKFGWNIELMYPSPRSFSLCKFNSLWTNLELYDRIKEPLCKAKRGATHYMHELTFDFLLLTIPFSCNS